MTNFCVMMCETSEGEAKLLGKAGSGIVLTVWIGVDSPDSWQPRHA